MLTLFAQTTWADEDVVHHPCPPDFKATRLHTISYQPTAAHEKVVVSVGFLYKVEGISNDLLVTDIVVYKKSHK